MFLWNKDAFVAFQAFHTAEGMQLQESRLFGGCSADSNLPVAAGRLPDS